MKLEDLYQDIQSFSETIKNGLYDFIKTDPYSNSFAYYACKRNFKGYRCMNFIGYEIDFEESYQGLPVFTRWSLEKEVDDDYGSNERLIHINKFITLQEFLDGVEWMKRWSEKRKTAIQRWERRKIDRAIPKTNTNVKKEKRL